MLSLARRKFCHLKYRLTFQCSFSIITESQNSVFINVSTDGKKLNLTDHKDDSHSYHAIWLRHHCQCPECMASTGQRTIPLNFLRGDLKISTATIDGIQFLINQRELNNSVSKQLSAILQQDCVHVCVLSGVEEHS